MVQLGFLFKKLRKGQIESFGLVIIVIIFVLLFVFFIYIKTRASSDNISDRLLDIKTNNLRNSILKTTLCKDVSIKDEILNCNNGNSACGDCDELKNKIKTIIDKSLESKIKYEFTPYNLKRGECRGKIASSIQPIEEDLNVRIDLCF